MNRLHDSLTSGNGYKCRLMLHHLALPFERIEVDLLGGASRTEAFARLNPEQRIPVLELPDGTALPESNAILCYLADGTPWLPAKKGPTRISFAASFSRRSAARLRPWRP